MSEFGKAALNRFGMAGVIGAGVIAVLVWALAHFAAKPGTEVGVLWGLVTYTKEDATIPATVAAATSQTPETAGLPSQIASQTKEEVGVESQAPPTPFEISHDWSSEDSSRLNDLRASHNLRALRPLETDTPISKAPCGTFFYVFSGWIDTAPYSIEDIADRAPVYRAPTPTDADFELHCRQESETLFLLVYATEVDANRLLSKPDAKEVSFVVFVAPWDAFTSLIQLPFDRIVGSTPRAFQVEEDATLSGLDIVVK